MEVLESTHLLPLELESSAKVLPKEDLEVLLRCSLVMILDIKQVMMPGLMIATLIET
jgi:hypothetical protein